MAVTLRIKLGGRMEEGKRSPGEGIGLYYAIENGRDALW